MIYPYECNDCETQSEVICKIADRPDVVVCQECGGTCRRIIAGNQAVHGDEAPWIDDAITHAVSSGSDVRRPVGRNELNKYLKDNSLAHVG